jgi:hypothetical protein
VAKPDFSLRRRHPVGVGRLPVALQAEREVCHRIEHRGLLERAGQAVVGIEGAAEQPRNRAANLQLLRPAEEVAVPPVGFEAESFGVGIDDAAADYVPLRLRHRNGHRDGTVGVERRAGADAHAGEYAKIAQSALGPPRHQRRIRPVAEAGAPGDQLGIDPLGTGHADPAEIRGGTRVDDERHIEGPAAMVGDRVALADRGEGMSLLPPRLADGRLGRQDDGGTGGLAGDKSQPLEVHAVRQRVDGHAAEDELGSGGYVHRDDRRPDGDRVEWPDRLQRPAVDGHRDLGSVTRVLVEDGGQLGDILARAGDEPGDARDRRLLLADQPGSLAQRLFQLCVRAGGRQRHRVGESVGNYLSRGLLAERPPVGERGRRRRCRTGGQWRSQGQSRERGGETRRRNGQFPIIRLSRIALPPSKSRFSGRYCRLIMKNRYIRKPCVPWRGNSIFSRPRLSRRRQGRFNPASSRPAKRRHSPREGRRPRFETTWMSARLRFLIPFRDSMVASIGRPDCVG